MPRPRRAAWWRQAHAARTKHQIETSDLMIVARSGIRDYSYVHDNWDNYNSDGDGDQDLRNKQQDRHKQDQQPYAQPSNGSH